MLVNRQHNDNDVGAWPDIDFLSVKAEGREDVIWDYVRRGVICEKTIIEEPPLLSIKARMRFYAFFNELRWNKLSVFPLPSSGEK